MVERMREKSEKARFVALREGRGGIVYVCGGMGCGGVEMWLVIYSRGEKEQEWSLVLRVEWLEW
jgi:hypothetical protein